MPPFRFRLQRVLAWYERRCRIEEDRLRAILSDLSKNDADKVRLREEREATERSIVESASPDPAEFAALARYIEGTKRELIALDEKRLQLETMLREQQTRVNALRTRIRLLEKLRERRLAEHVAGEQKELEELAADAFRAATSRQALAGDRSQP
ncbi:MAG TPA: hypothetical protein VEF06_07470 [Bryobacteraceae bacterium]|nr:hypothetical protein [Bryobacteraceae bacterium]